MVVLIRPYYMEADVKYLLSLALVLVASSVQAQEPIDWNFRLSALEARVTALESQLKPSPVATTPTYTQPVMYFQPQFAQQFGVGGACVGGNCAPAQASRTFMPLGGVFRRR